MTGTPSRTARVPTARWDLKEAAGKAPNRGTRCAYEARNRGRGSGDFLARRHPERLRVDATGLGRRSRALPWEICARAMEGRTSPLGVARGAQKSAEGIPGCRTSPRPEQVTLDRCRSLDDQSSRRK
jgi:hypothetical protein